MLCFPHSKINIGLNIINKRSDGFHNIETVFYPVDLCDALEFVEIQDESNASDRNVLFNSSGIKIDGSNNDNLCVKAYNILKQDYDLPALNVHLHKAIPIGAGLGGGSSDAVFMLKALNTELDLKISNEKLIGYSQQLGSDCAFFVSGEARFAYNKGDCFKDVNLNLDGYHIVIIYPKIHISTAEAYSGITPKKPEASLIDLVKQPINEWKDIIVNDFETGIFNMYPEIENIKNKLYISGAVYSSMSGSGSSVYGIFESEPKLSSDFDKYFVWSGRR